MKNLFLVLPKTEFLTQDYEFRHNKEKKYKELIIYAGIFFLVTQSTKKMLFIEDYSATYFN